MTSNGAITNTARLRTHESGCALARMRGIAAPEEIPKHYRFRQEILHLRPPIETRFLSQLRVLFAPRSRESSAPPSARLRRIFYRSETQRERRKSPEKSSYQPIAAALSIKHLLHRVYAANRLVLVYGRYGLPDPGGESDGSAPRITTTIELGGS